MSDNWYHNKKNLKTEIKSPRRTYKHRKALPRFKCCEAELITEPGFYTYYIHMTVSKSQSTVFYPEVIVHLDSLILYSVVFLCKRHKDSETKLRYDTFEILCYKNTGICTVAQ